MLSRCRWLRRIQQLQLRKKPWDRTASLQATAHTHTHNGLQNIKTPEGNYCGEFHAATTEIPGCDDSHLDGHMIFKATGYSFNRLRAHLSIRTYCISLFPFFTSQQQKIGYHFIGRYLKMLPHRNTIIIILWLLLLVLSSFRHNRQAERLTKLHSRWSNG